MLRNKRDLLQIEESKVPILICEHEELDTTTPRGKNLFGKLVLDAELEAARQASIFQSKFFWFR